MSKESKPPRRAPLYSRLRIVRGAEQSFEVWMQIERGRWHVVELNKSEAHAVVHQLDRLIEFAENRAEPLRYDGEIPF